MSHRKIEYTDITVSIKDLRKLKKGYVVVKRKNGHGFSIQMRTADRRTARKIKNLEAQIRTLKAKEKTNG